VNVAPYIGMTVGQVSSIFGATLVAASWQEEHPRRSALVAGVGLIGLGVVLSVVSSSAQGGRR
jgi:threonine dehydrogenase-like Zn-dependent dehydrogenase